MLAHRADGKTVRPTVISIRQKRTSNEQENQSSKIHWLIGFHDMDVAAAALSLGLPEGTVKARLSRGREILLVTILEGAKNMGVGWIALALLMAFASVGLSMRLAGARAGTAGI